MTSDFRIFANGRSIAARSAEAGKSEAAFPDVCGSPPYPAKVGVPVPYANTAFAKDTANGSTTVFAYGEPIVKRDLSYFAKSIGDEPATERFKKGMLSGEINGRAYFVSWSMNVFVEGLNVCRHDDLMTHNHKK